jgi:hypothetical protein
MKLKVLRGFLRSNPPDMSSETLEFATSTPKGPDKFAMILSGEAKKLLTMDRYERRALARRKFAIRAFDAARARTATTAGKCHADLVKACSPAQWLTQILQWRETNSRLGRRRGRKGLIAWLCICNYKLWRAIFGRTKPNCAVLSMAAEGRTKKEEGMSLGIRIAAKGVVGIMLIMTAVAAMLLDPRASRAALTNIGGGVMHENCTLPTFEMC